MDGALMQQRIVDLRQEALLSEKRDYREYGKDEHSRRIGADRNDCNGIKTNGIAAEDIFGHVCNLP
jgi:hypothetical protein